MRTKKEIKERLDIVRGFVGVSDNLDDRNYWIREEFILEWILGEH